ncbi:MAG TPA: hypothetical protein VJI98_01140, partial [Candidatus Nanoarchaeia archaeon]|nr:hypothetical protein [Candidatus Nanoarchaeia archaeon]
YQLQMILEQVKVPEGFLVKDTSRFVGSLREGIRKAKAVIKLGEDGRNDIITQEIKRQLQGLIQQENEGEKWLRALEVGLDHLKRWVEGNEPRSNRRAFFKTLSAAGALALSQQACNQMVNFEQVVAGQKIVQEYINDLVKMPEIQEVLKRGWLLGVYYNLTKDKLVDVFSRFYEMEGIISGDNLKETALLRVKSILDNNYWMYTVGSKVKLKVPTYILISEDVFSKGRMFTDADIRNILRHEVKHVDSYFNGMFTQGEQITAERYSERVRYTISELRSLIAEIEYLLRNTSRGFSIKYIQNVCRRFTSYTDDSCKHSSVAKRLISDFIRRTSFFILTKNGNYELGWTLNMKPIFTVPVEKGLDKCPYDFS